MTKNAIYFDKNSILDMFSLLPLPLIHEIGHWFVAFAFGVEVVETFLIPQRIGNRIGIGLIIDARAYQMNLSTYGTFLISELTRKQSGTPIIDTTINFKADGQVTPSNGIMIATMIT